MNTLYALFATYDGDGMKLTFITTATKEAIEAFTHTNAAGIGHARFVIGTSDDTISTIGLFADQRTWHIDMWDIDVQVGNFPIFE